MAQVEFRKGPWTETEDAQLILYVNLFGDRRWDFIAKVSGLKVAGDNANMRTGKSCRLRWVNYLHPGLRRGKMTPHEERLVLEYHAKWGNRWSRIAGKLPGRTDNEIKNYWRTHMRKKAQEMKQAWSLPSSSFYTSSSSMSSINAMPMVDNERSFDDTGGMFIRTSSASNSSSSSFHATATETKYCDTGGLEMLIPKKRDNEEEKTEIVTSGEDIWKDIELFESEELITAPSKIMISPITKDGPDTLWVTEEQRKMKETVFPSITDHLFACYGLEGMGITD